MRACKRMPVNSLMGGSPQARVGMYLSDETEQKFSQSLTGRHLSEEHRKNISLALTGRHHTKESRKKMSESHKGLSLSVRLTLERKKRQRAYHKKYYQANREKIVSYIRKHRKDNWEHYRDYTRKRKLDKVDAVFELFGYSVDSLNKMGAALES